MNKQEIFDKVIAHCVEQGTQANNGASCMYWMEEYVPAGDEPTPGTLGERREITEWESTGRILRCAIGALIPAEVMPDDNWKGLEGSIGCLFEEYPMLRPILEPSDVEKGSDREMFLADLQDMHDCYRNWLVMEDGSTRFIRPDEEHELTENLPKNIAEAWGLVLNYPT